MGAYPEMAAENFITEGDECWGPPGMSSISVAAAVFLDLSLVHLRPSRT